MQLLDYERVPPHVEQRIVEAAQKSKEAEAHAGH